MASFKQYLAAKVAGLTTAALDDVANQLSNWSYLHLSFMETEPTQTELEVMMHVELTGRNRVQILRRALAARALPLTDREQDVCARIVAGYSSEAIALDLGLAASSVATYRKRAYAKLGICSQHDLFALCWGGDAEIF